MVSWKKLDASNLDIKSVVIASKSFKIKILTTKFYNVLLNWKWEKTKW